MNPFTYRCPRVEKRSNTIANIKKYTKKDGTAAYMFQAYLGTNSATGKRIRVTRQGFDTKKEASLALSRLKLARHYGQWHSYSQAPRHF